MLASTRLTALRAAAKVTLSASILGCGGATATEDGGLLPASQEGGARAPFDAAIAVTRGMDAGSRMVGPCPGATESPDGAVSEGTFACCIGYLTAETHDAGGAFPALDGSTPAAHECCATVVAFVDHGGFSVFSDVDAAAYPTREGALQSCCEALSSPDGGPPIGAACTPWGPPVPPAMTDIAFHDWRIS